MEPLQTIRPIINDEFLKTRPLSYSSLKQFRKSPKHYILYLTKPFEISDAMILGKAIDCLALTPELMDKQFCIYTPFSKRSNADKEKWQTMCEEANKNKTTLITQEQLEQAKVCVQALYTQPESKLLLENKTRVQVKLEWFDKTNRLPIIGYSDFESKCWDANWVVDLKGTKSADPEDFNKDIFKFLYNIQMGCYSTGYAKKFFRFPEFMNLAVETTEPNNVSLFHWSNKDLNAAKDEFNGLLKAFRKCMDEDLWHMGYEFWLMGTKNYFSVNKPGYYKPKTFGIEEEED